MSEDVMFKGSRYGLQLILSDAADFAKVEQQLKEKLESAFSFFSKGTVVRIAADRLTAEQLEHLTRLLGRYDLSLKPLTQPSEKMAASEKKEDAVLEEEIPGINETMIVGKTVRGGQEVICNGSVIIHGNVNPSATVIAGGNIHIHGTCRGIVHAGAFGNTKAYVIADHMMAMQIRIAELIARAPDYVEKPDHIERAVIKNGQIVIEPVNRNEGARA